LWYLDFKPGQVKDPSLIIEDIDDNREIKKEVKTLIRCIVEETGTHTLVDFSYDLKRQTRIDGVLMSPLL
jgi:hypothetical protein